ncbi:MAG: LysM peptidoglycan-binding domain-containing protein [Nibricoccus sp.]
MKILKIFGVVVAVHAAVFMFVFAIPGCSTKSRPAPKEPAPETGTAAPSVSYPGAPVDSAGAVAGTETPAPEGMPQVSFNSQRYNPTRPGSSAAGVLQSSEVTGVTPASTYKVQPNDSLWKIAKKHGLGVEDLAKANGLRPNTPLKVGQKLIVPGKSPKAGAAPSGTRMYTVKAGDSLGVIARKQGTTVADIRSLNPDLKSDTVRAGQELVLPASGKSAGSTASTVSAPPVVPSSTVAAPTGSVEHIVLPGEGLQQIARKYGVPQREIAFANQISDPKNIRAGQKLIIPGVKTPGAAEPAVTPPAEQTPVAPATPVENPVTPPPASEASPVAPAEAPPVVKVEESTPVTPVAPNP